MLLPALAAAKKKAQKINCTNNLKQVGLAYRIWSGDNSDKYPMSVSSAQGGAQEFVARANNTAPQGTGAAYIPGKAFQVMSNELSTPKIVFCPSDSLHSAGNGYATNFSNADLLGGGAAGNTTKISYFINGDATESDPQMVMSGDCNIGLGGAANAPATSWTSVSHTAGSLCNSAATANAANGWAWTQSDLHAKSGNVQMADGSVQSCTVSGLRTYLQNGTNTVATPVFNFFN